MEINDDTYIWLDDCFDQFDYVCEKTVVYYDCGLIKYNNCKGTWDICIDPRETIVDTFIICDRKNNCYQSAFRSQTPRYLFNLSKRYNIKTIIFTRCEFSVSPGRINLPTNITEIVFDKCVNIDNILTDILKPSTKEYNLKSIVFRNIDNISHILPLLKSHMINNNYIKTVKIINCRPYITESCGEIDNLRLKANEQNIKECSNSLKANRLGYEQCQEVCLVFIGLKKYKLTSSVSANDVNVILKIVKMIWDSRYQNEWYYVKYNL